MIKFKDWLQTKQSQKLEGSFGRSLAATGLGTAAGTAATALTGNPAIGAAAMLGAAGLAGRYLPHWGVLDGADGKKKKQKK